MLEKIHEFFLMNPNPSRLIISFCCWLIASPAVLMSFTIGPLIKPRYVVFSIMLFAWVALAIMNLGWLARKKVHWFWPVAGTVCGLPCSLLFGIQGWYPIFFSVVPLAFYLVYFNFRKAGPPPRLRGSPA